jgi:hypothetical protein
MVAMHTITIEDFTHEILLDAHPPHGILDPTEVNLRSYLGATPANRT